MRKKYTEEFEVYKLKDAAQSQFVAVKMEGKYYVFKNDKYAPPSTLGELFDLVDLSKVIELNTFSENGDGPNKNHFVLNNDDYVWEVLAGCENADFVEDDKWKVHDRDYERHEPVTKLQRRDICSRRCFRLEEK